MAMRQTNLSLISPRDLIVAQLAPTAKSGAIRDDVIGWSTQSCLSQSLLQPLDAAQIDGFDARSQSEAASVLITNVTGFLGAAVLHATLHSSALRGREIFGLVRPYHIAATEDKNAAA